MRVAGILAGVAAIPLISMILSSELFLGGRCEVYMLMLNCKRL
jgi:hypothetical protein